MRLDRYADQDSVDLVSDALNTGNVKDNVKPHGLDSRRRWYAKALGVWPDGATWEVAKAGVATLRMGDSGASVKRLQELLVSRGYFLGRVDGEYGQRVADAVVLFQSHHGLQIDGEAGPLTFATLEKAPPREERTGVTAQSMAQQGDPTITFTQRFKLASSTWRRFWAWGQRYRPAASPWWRRLSSRPRRLRR
jgi:peptidoglycan hydrolase-like protein with peptidoglycan-binding domain